MTKRYNGRWAQLQHLRQQQEAFDRKHYESKPSLTVLNHNKLWFKGRATVHGHLKAQMTKAAKRRRPTLPKLKFMENP